MLLAIDTNITKSLYRILVNENNLKDEDKLKNKDTLKNKKKKIK